MPGLFASSCRRNLSKWGHVVPVGRRRVFLDCRQEELSGLGLAVATASALGPPGVVGWTSVRYSGKANQPGRGLWESRSEDPGNY